MGRILRYAAASIASAALLLALALTVLFSGMYNFAADDEHFQIVAASIAKAREASIDARSRQIAVPPLRSDEMIIAGAGNYQAMCAQCHLSPALGQTELSIGLYPKPPKLSVTRVTPSAAFWTIKHGVKASGMPAWGKSMPDDDIWNLVAFLQKMPSLQSDDYLELVDKSKGHSHRSAARGAAVTTARPTDSTADHSDQAH